MENSRLTKLLEGVANGKVGVEEAVLQLKMEPFEDLGFAKLDYHRSLRQGVGEVIYGEGKTGSQILEIAKAFLEKGETCVLITRMSEDKANLVSKELPLEYDTWSRVGIVGDMPQISGRGKIVIASGGTSDMPVAREAELTARALGNQVVCLYDVGVAGLHRLLAHIEDLMSARAVIAVAGMEGALASVVGGLVACPVIAVPTSVGYGASFGGVSALLSMLNSCASGVSVVNIDNGFGAGYLASMINHIS